MNLRITRPIVVAAITTAWLVADGRLADRLGVLIAQSPPAAPLSAADAVPRARNGDFGGDGKTDVTVFRPSTGIWYVRNVVTGVFEFYQWGLDGDIPVQADYDGDGKADIAVFRPSTGIWYVRYSSNGANVFLQWGLNGDIPVPGDYNGDGKMDTAVFRPSTGTWYVRDAATETTLFYVWGLSGDIPVAGDYDGDGKTDPTVYRPSTGIWYVRQSTTGSPAFLQWGLTGDIPAPGDYDGDGKADAAVFRPSTGIWYVRDLLTNSPSFYQWGISGDVPMAGDFDGDGKTDIAVFRPSTSIWYVRPSSSPGAPGFYQWGMDGDIPIPDRSIPPSGNRLPTLTGITVSPQGMGILQGTNFAFTAQASDPDGDTLSYAWDFGDGTTLPATANRITANRIYTSIGSRTVRVTMTDGRGGSATTTVPVSVGNLTGVWDITCPHPAFVNQFFPTFPTAFVVTLSQSGKNVTGTIAGGGLSRSFPSTGAALANVVNDPRRVNFGVETVGNVWAQQDGDFYFNMTVNATLTSMTGTSLYCLAPVATKR